MLPAAFAGCSLFKSAPPPPAIGQAAQPPSPTRLVVSLQAAAGLNPAVSGRPSPLRLRLYELKATATFLRADFMALYQADQATLGADLLAREELVVQPGENRPFLRELTPATQHLGVLAFYRDLEHAVWRTTVALPPQRDVNLLLRCDALAVAATPAP